MSVGVCEFNCEYVLLRFYLRVTGYEITCEEASATLDHLLETLDFRGRKHGVERSTIVLCGTT